MSMRSPRHLPLIGVALGCALLAASVVVNPRPLLVWNATASAPVGLYGVSPLDATPLRNRDFVLIRLSPELRGLYAERGYVPADVPLLKRIAATGGQKVCEQAGVLSIDGRRVATAMSTDARGRPLTAWSGCRRLQAYEVFALMPDVPASLDGRYFGPTPISSIMGRAQPLWTLGSR